MGFNKKVLSKAVSELGKAKAPGKPKDIIVDPAGQWKYPGQKTRIPSSDITMQGVNYPVFAQPNVGPGTIMYPNQDYQFPGADYVDETPLAKKGGTLQSKKYSKNMSATNKLFAKNKLFQNKKSKIFDPNAKFKSGGSKLGPINLNPNPLSHYELNYGFNLPIKQDGGAQDKFNSKLKDDVLKSFDEHAKQFPSLLNDTYDYDTKGFYNEVYNKHNGDFDKITEALTPGSPTAHVGTDRYKKPNHPTFSKESIYHIPIIRPAGKWGHDEEGDYFKASRKNIKNMNESDGSPYEYFQRAEDYDQDGKPDVRLKYRGKILFEDGGESDYEELELTPEEIQEYKDNGYIVDELPEAQEGGPKDTIIYPPGDSEYMNQPALNYDILEMQNQKARRNYEQYLKDSTDPTNIQRTSPSFQQKYFMNKDVVNAKTGGFVQHELVKAQTGGSKFKRTAFDEDAKSNVGWSSAPVAKKKPLTTTQKKIQKTFDKNFKVTDKSKYEKTEDKIAEDQKAYVDWTKKTGRTFTDADLKSIADQQWSFAGVGPQQSEDMMRATPEQSSGSRAWEYITNPFTAAEYAISGGGAENMPHNINEMRMAGIDPGVVPGRNIVGNMLNSSLNLFDAGDKVVRNTARGNYGAAALEALRFAPGSGLLDDAVRLGVKPGAKYLGKALGTESGLLSNAYKVNPFAFKPNPTASYRMLGKNGLEDARQSGVFRSNQVDIYDPYINNKAFDEVYYSQGVPFDGRKYKFSQDLIDKTSYAGTKNNRVWNWEKFKGPHMVEVNNSHNMPNFNTYGASPLENFGYEITTSGNKPVLFNDPNVNIYKQHWLKGYKKVPKEIPGSPNNNVRLEFNPQRSNELNSISHDIHYGNQKVGEVSGNYKSNGDFEISDVGVDKAFQKKGISKEAYNLLNEAHPNNKVVSFGAYNTDAAGMQPGKNLWESLVREGKAKKVGNSYEMLNSKNISSGLSGSPNIISSVDDAGKSLTQVPQSAKSTWQIQEMPGLHLKSTMEGQAVSKIVEPKTGLINTEQALAIIGKESGGAEKVALIKQGLGETIPKKMDYNDFRQVVQDQLIPLERQFATHASNYGIERLGYLPKVQGNAFQRVQTFLNTPVSDINKKRLLENQTLILGNKNKLGIGSSAHGNPEETLGHIHFFRDAETPDVLTVTQIQSDAFQGTHRIMPEKLKIKINEWEKILSSEGRKELVEAVGEQFADSIQENAKEFIAKAEKETAEILGQNPTQKQLLDKNHQERYLQELVNYAGERGDISKLRLPTSETAANVQGYYSIADYDKQVAKEVLMLQKEGKSRNDIITLLESKHKMKLEEDDLKKLDQLLQEGLIYSPEHSTILKKYSEQPKLIKKLFGQESKIVTDSKGNTWYEFDMPENFKGKKGEIKAFSIGGAIESWEDELDDEEIARLKRAGYIIEEVN